MSAVSRGCACSLSVRPCSSGDLFSFPCLSGWKGPSSAARKPCVPFSSGLCSFLVQATVSCSPALSLSRSPPFPSLPGAQPCWCPVRLHSRVRLCLHVCRRVSKRMREQKPVSRGVHLCLCT